MDADPKPGVVEANCRVHEVGNLYVAGRRSSRRRARRSDVDAGRAQPKVVGSPEVGATLNSQRARSSRKDRTRQRLIVRRPKVRCVFDLPCASTANA